MGSAVARSTDGFGDISGMPDLRRLGSTSCATAQPSFGAKPGSRLEAVSAFLDHSSLAVTTVYLRRLEGVEDRAWGKGGGSDRSATGRWLPSPVRRLGVLNRNDCSGTF